MITVEVSTETEELPQVAASIIELLKSYPIALFYGDMGAGKTTLIKYICKMLGMTHGLSSPTFGLVNEYQAASGVVYHFDCYRIKSAEEALYAGIEEYLYSGNVCLIEWPQVILSIIPKPHVVIEIENKQPLRIIRIYPNGTV
jgi:tRNA threonylcarbamoyladenosine biosynthesis protein TsaE